MSKHILSIAIILLSISIVYMGFQVSHVVSSKSNDVVNEDTEVSFETQKGLWSLDETAAYLGLPTEELKAVISQQIQERNELGSYDTYKFISYIKIRGELYFNKAEIDKWIEYSSQIHEEY